MVFAHKASSVSLCALALIILDELIGHYANQGLRGIML